MLIDEFRKIALLERGDIFDSTGIFIKSIPFDSRETNRHENKLLTTVDKLNIMNNEIAIQQRIILKMTRLSLISFILSLAFIVLSMLNFLFLAFYGHGFLYMPLSLGLLVIGTTIFGTMYLLNK